MSTPHTSPDLKHFNNMTMDEYVKMLEGFDGFDLDEPKELATCFTCHQIALSVFASLKNKETHNVFCSSSCFHLYRKKKTEQVVVPQNEEKAVRPSISNNVKKIRNKKPL